MTYYTKFFFAESGCQSHVPAQIAENLKLPIGRSGRHVFTDSKEQTITILCESSFHFLEKEDISKLPDGAVWSVRHWTEIGRQIVTSFKGPKIKSIQF